MFDPQNRVHLTTIVEQLRPDDISDEAVAMALNRTQADSKTKRQGSTAETLFGPGPLLTAHDIWLARLEGTT